MAHALIELWRLLCANVRYRRIERAEAAAAQLDPHHYLNSLRKL